MTFSWNMEPQENNQHALRWLAANHRKICCIDKNKRLARLRNQYEIAFPNVNC